VRKKVLLLIVAVIVFTNVITFNYARSLDTEASLPENDEEAITEEEEALQMFLQVWDKICSEYLKEVSPRQLAEGAVQGMLETLDDPETYYLSSEKMDDMMIELSGSFTGIGVEMTQMDKELYVVRVFPGSPAEKAGVLPGDTIVGVGGILLEGEDLIHQATEMIRGPKGTPVTLEILRPGRQEIIVLEIIRDEIDISTIKSKILSHQIGYIKIVEFVSGTAKQMQTEMSLLEAQKVKGLILDLRGNPGGLLKEAIRVCEILVPEGEITRVVDMNGSIQKRYMSTAVPKDYPIVVLIDAGSASASEIVAGALQDRGAALLVGEKTFGKATVQQIIPLDGGGGLRYTIAKYQTPSGKDIHQDGIVPDYRVSQPDNYYLTQHVLMPGLEKGDTSNMVFLLQKIMNVLGYELEETGQFDTDTEKVLLQFQADNSLEQTGWLDQLTAEEISRQIEDYANKWDFQLKKAEEIILAIGND